MRESTELNSGANATPPANDLFAGTQFHMVRPLGQGGMGELFLVKHTRVERPLVAKFLHHSLMRDPQLVDRMRVEAQSLGRLENDNIVDITGYECTPSGRPFLVMEYLVGRTLEAELQERGALPLLDALDYAHQALNALGAAHAIGIAHRDVKPSNMLVSQVEVDGSTVVTLKLLDFGLARVLPGVSDQAPRPLVIPTETGAVLGTLRYLSPEAALGKRVDHRADLYSLALVLYEMLVGHGPFEHLRHDFLTAHTVEDALPPSHYAKRPIPAELDLVVLHGLAKNPDQRYQSAEEFKSELVRIFNMLRHSQGMQTTVFAPPGSTSFRTTGQLWRQPAPSPASVATHERVYPNESANPRAPRPHAQSPLAVEPERRPSPTLLVASVLVAVVTAVVLTIGVVALLARFAP